MRKAFLLWLLLCAPFAHGQSVINDNLIKRVYIDLGPWDMTSVPKKEIALPTGLSLASHVLNMSAMIYSDLFALSSGSTPDYTETYRFDRLAARNDPSEGGCSLGCGTL